MAVGEFHLYLYHAVALVLAIPCCCCCFFSFFLLIGDIVNIMRELCMLRDVTMHCTAQSRGVCAPTPIHPLRGSAQGTSETSENKCADIQKGNSYLQHYTFLWEL